MTEAEKDAHAAAPSANAEAVGSLRRLKETERSSDKRLSEVRTRGETKIKYAQAARDRTLTEARQQAESARVQRLRDAQRQAEAEAKQILDGARSEAARWGEISSAEVDARMDQVLGAVLGDLRASPPATPSSKSSSKAAASR